MFWQRGIDPTFLVVDVGTSSLRAALVTYPRKGDAKPIAGSIVRSPLDPPQRMDAKLLRRHTQKGLHAIFADVLAVRPKLHGILLGLASPFYISHTAHRIVERKRPDAPITTDEIRAFVEDGEREFLETARKRISQNDIAVFTHSIITTRVNGYPVGDLTGKSGKTIEIAIRYEGTTAVLERELFRASGHMFPGVPVYLCSLPYAYFSTLKKIERLGIDMVVVDVGGEVTELSFIVEGVLEKVFTVPLGNNVLLRECADLFHVSLSDAEFLMRRYIEDSLENDQKKSMQMLLGSLEQTWINSFKKTLLPYVKLHSMPLSFILTGGGAIVPFFHRLLSTIPEHVGIRSPVAIAIAQPSLVNGVFERHLFQKTEEFGLACLALYCGDFVSL